MSAPPGALAASTANNGDAERESSPNNGNVEENGSSQLHSQPTEVIMTEEDFDLRHHKQLTAQRNFDTIIFESWKIKPWYYSPYPLTESETDEIPASSSSSQPFNKIPGVARVTGRSHGRTSDLLAGGLLRQHAGESTLWVCHLCFKYTVDGTWWEKHKACPPAVVLSLSHRPSCNRGIASWYIPQGRRFTSVEHIRYGK